MSRTTGPASVTWASCQGILAVSSREIWLDTHFSTCWKSLILALL